MSIVEYEKHFYILSKCLTTSNFIEFKSIQKFVRGFDGLYKLATTKMVDLGAYLQSIIEHTKFIESIIQATQVGTKMVHTQGKFSPIVIMVGHFRPHCMDQVVDLQVFWF